MLGTEDRFQGRGPDVRTFKRRTRPEAIALAEATQKDPRMVQLILDESTEVLRHKPNVLIVRHKLGIVGAHAGIDQSNIDHQDEEQALLLPKDPDASATQLRDALQQQTGCGAGRCDY